MSEEKYSAETAQAKALCAQIAPLLAGVVPNIVGGVLGEMIGIYFAGHNPTIRDEVRQAFNVMVDEVIAIMDAKRRVETPKDWDVVFSDQAEAKMAEDPEAAVFVREQLARIRQVIAEHEAGRFATVGDALRSIGMEPVSALELGIDDDDQTIN